MRVLLYGRLAGSGDGCGGHFAAQNGTFTSPGYPSLASHAHNCTWTIEVSVAYPSLFVDAYHDIWPM